jgi:outer membrane protein assembly factor BamB
VKVAHRLSALHNPFALGLAAAIACNSPSPGPEGSGVRERWYQAQPGWGWARPAVFGSTVYFGTGDGQVIARDVNTGAPRWSARVGTQPIHGANLIARSGVVIAPVVSYTVGLDALTGRELWRYEAPNDTTGRGPSGVINPGQVSLSRIDADDGTVYIPAWGASVSALDLHAGVSRWVWQPGRMEGDTAASGVFRSGSMGVRMSGDTLFATVWHNVTRLGGTSEAWVVALDRLTGREFWRVRLPYQGGGVLIEAPPAIYKNLVIVHTLSARAYAIDRGTLKVAWEFRSPTATLSTTSAPELYDNVAYLDGGDGNLYALGAGDGRVIWRSPFATQTSDDLLVTNRRITFTNGGELFVIDRLTGARIATAMQPRTNDSFFASAAAFANGLVFITVGDGAWCFEEP